MRLALFDLDHTLLPIDSADAWSHFVVRAGDRDVDAQLARIHRFSEEYRSGSFDPQQYLDFQMGLLAGMPRARLAASTRTRDFCTRRGAEVDVLDPRPRCGSGE